MQKSQFTDEQIVAILQQAEKGDKPIAENTFYRVIASGERTPSTAGAHASAACKPKSSPSGEWQSP